MLRPRTFFLYRTTLPRSKDVAEWSAEVLKRSQHSQVGEKDLRQLIVAATANKLHEERRRILSFLSAVWPLPPAPRRGRVDGQASDTTKRSSLAVVERPELPPAKSSR